MANIDRDDTSVIAGSRRLAVLIDADNISPNSIYGVFQELNRFGTVTAKRAHGNSDILNSKKWLSVLERDGIDLFLQPTFGKGKNGADIALVIDGMDLLHSRRFDGFAIVSGDSDFAALAARIRAEGLDAFIFGGKTTPERFRLAGTKFVYVENLKPSAPANDPKSRSKPLKQPSDAVTLIKETAWRLCASHKDWISIDALAAELDRNRPDFDPRTYGFRP